jgi:hypothetical protein
LVTICHQLAPLIAQALFEFVPVFPGNGRIRLLCEDADDVDDREKSRFRGFVVHTAYWLILEESGLSGDGQSQRLPQKPDAEKAFGRCLPFLRCFKGQRKGRGQFVPSL